MYIHFVCFRSLRSYGVPIPAADCPVHVERGAEISSLDLANAVQQLKIVIKHNVKVDRDVGDSGVGESLGAHCGVEVEAGGRVEFLGGGHLSGCTIRARGKAGRYVPLTQGNDVCVATAGHPMREGDMCEIVCTCGGQMSTFKGECVLSHVPAKADLFTCDSLDPNVAVVKLINPDDADIAHSFQHIFIRHGSQVHLTLPPQMRPVMLYHKPVLVFLDGDTEPIKGKVSEVLSTVSRPSLIQGKFIIQIDDPSYQLAPGTVVCLDNSVPEPVVILGLVVAKRRGSPEYLVFNLRYSLDRVCTLSELYKNRTFHL